VYKRVVQKRESEVENINGIVPGAWESVTMDDDTQQCMYLYLRTYCVCVCETRKSTIVVRHPIQLSDCV